MLFVGGGRPSRRVNGIGSAEKVRMLGMAAKRGSSPELPLQGRAGAESTPNVVILNCISQIWVRYGIVHNYIYLTRLMIILAKMPNPSSIKPFQIIHNLITPYQWTSINTK